MKPEIIIAIVSAAIAFAAFGFSIYTFQAQRADAKAIARASVRPILKIRTQKYLDQKAIILANRGLGPALIQSASFTKGTTATNNVVELLPNLIWDTFVNVPSNTVLPAGEEYILVQLKASSLVRNGLSEEDALHTLAKVENAWSGIAISIDFENAHGEKQDQFNLVLK